MSTQTSLLGIALLRLSFIDSGAALRSLGDNEFFSFRPSRATRKTREDRDTGATYGPTWWPHAAAAHPRPPCTSHPWQADQWPRLRRMPVYMYRNKQFDGELWRVNWHWGEQTNSMRFYAETYLAALWKMKWRPFPCVLDAGLCSSCINLCTMMITCIWRWSLGETYCDLLMSLIMYWQWMINADVSWCSNSATC